MQELTLKTAKRGQRIAHGGGRLLLLKNEEQEKQKLGYIGTVIEVTKSIPGATNHGKPGVLVHFDYLNDVGETPQILPEEMAEESVMDPVQWVAFMTA